MREAKKWSLFFFTLSLLFTWILTLSWGWSQTYVSGKVITADGKVVASGAVALEKGELHNNAFRAGGVINADGTFKIPLPSGAPGACMFIVKSTFIFHSKFKLLKNLTMKFLLSFRSMGIPATTLEFQTFDFPKLTIMYCGSHCRWMIPTTTSGPRCWRLIPNVLNLIG
jgi:hypothetical protein